MYVLSTEEDDGIAEMTISIADEDHRFDVWTEGDEALVEYQETLSWRGQIRVSEPDEDVYRELMLSDEMTQLLTRWGVSGVRRADIIA
jgi:hypothetical protein